MFNKYVRKEGRGIENRRGQRQVKREGKREGKMGGGREKVM